MSLFKKAAPVIQEAQDKSEPKLVVIVGSENSLFPLFIAQTITDEDSGVLLIDNSRTQDLYEPVPKDNKIGNADEVCVVSNRIYSPDVFKKFDYTIAYLGYNVQDDYIENADFIIVLSDYTLVSRDFLAQLELKNKPARIVFYNKVSTRVTEKMLLDVMQKNTALDTDVIVSLEFTEDDANAYINFLYEGTRSISTASKDMRNAIALLNKDIKLGYQQDVQVEIESED
ncbi:hypothetical protein bpr_II280 (plasmid) [Butyrivibrio proteoclasticus B316]|uniref:Uncharacterized protein n=1 Tax=Butyrivibrio proteoclasticus (strain ATCC 51982 / DSM 14932 / B316) TaxID=515622 RepID=E0S485_BUTPB|nr:hypothetical protein [Butyrivibrio proteoclasticus]ADL36217.1 hypothetical protein bpr_II280 [Butyrivibrio proteoclasticus B316]